MTDIEMADAPNDPNATTLPGPQFQEGVSLEGRDASKDTDTSTADQINPLNPDPVKECNSQPSKTTTPEVPTIQTGYNIKTIIKEVSPQKPRLTRTYTTVPSSHTYRTSGSPTRAVQDSVDYRCHDGTRQYDRNDASISGDRIDPEEYKAQYDAMYKSHQYDDPLLSTGYSQSSRSSYTRTSYRPYKAEYQNVPTHDDIIEDLKSKLARATQAGQKLQLEYDTAQAKIQSLLDEKERQGEIIRSMQDKAFSQFEDPAWMPESNADIERKLKNLDADIKQWAKEFAVKKLEDIKVRKAGAQSENYWENLREVVKLEKGKLPAALVKDNRPWVLLHASLAFWVYNYIFDDPFFFIKQWMDEIDSRDGSRKSKSRNFTSSVREGLDTLYQKSIEVNRRETFAWRAQLLRLLDPPNRPGHTKEKLITRMKETTASARTMKSSETARWFLDVTGFLVTDKHSEVLQKKLMLVINRATEISYSLWVQKKSLRISYMRGLSPTFKASDGCMEAHPLNNKDLNDEPTALDGQPVLVQVHPAVLSYGNDDGSNYAVCSVLKKAICFMGPSRR